MASTYLTRTPASAGSRRTWTYSTWVKRSKLGLDADNVYGKYNTLFSNIGAIANNDDTFGLSFGSADRLSIGTGYYEWVVTNQVFRDTSSWYHIMLVLDTTQATANDRLKFYVNGSQITSFLINNLATHCVQNFEAGINTTSLHTIGSFGGTSPYFDGLMASTYFINAQALTPSSFGETDATTGIWKPKSYSGSYGTNGFFLKFENSASLGTDSSGNGNNFTVNGTPTQTVDTPSNVFATFNSIDKSGGTATTFSNGNLNVKHANGANGAVTAQRSTLAISKGKWYWEAKCIATGGDVRLGIISMSSTDYVTHANPYILNNCYNYKQTGQKGSSGGDSAYGATYTAGDIISILYDADNGSLTFYKNGTSQGVAFSSLDTSLTWGAWSSEYDSGEYAYNFGNGYFGSTAITSPYSDTAGLGKFQYAVPAGYYSLCTKNINSQG
jgi:hypothetical protein